MKRQIELENHIRNEDHTIHSIITYTFSFDRLERINSTNWDSNGKEWTNEQDHGFNYYLRNLTPEKLLADRPDAQEIL